MPGARYDGWHHLRYVGDRELAAQHLPHARKVLGFVRDQAAVNGLQTYKHVVELDGGGLIVGELIGGQLRATIDVRGVKKGGYQPLVEGFILQFTEELDSGASKPDPVMFSLPRESDADGTGTALFYNTDSFGAAETPREYRGTYSHVFGPRDNLGRQLASGALWTSRDGEAVTWWRGFSGYWPAHYAHPGAPYGAYVAIYGNVVFTVPSAGDRVMAAAARDGYLYVLLASGLWEYPSPTAPSAPATCGDIWVSQPYPDVFHVYRLYRLPLTVTTDVRGVRVYRAGKLEDGELLLDTPLPRAWGAWSFNRDVTKLVSIQLPKKAVLYHQSTYIPYVGSLARPGYGVSGDEHTEMPTDDSLRFEISITHDDGEVSASFSQAPAGSVVAEEDGVTLELVQHELSLFTRDHRTQVNYKCGDWELLAARSQDTWTSTEETVLTYERNTLLAAHLPTRAFLFYHVEQHLKPGPAYVRGRYRVFRQGASGAIEEVLDVDANPLDISSPLVGALALVSSPSVMGCGTYTSDGTAFEWFRAWDGITTLLTLTYDRAFLTIMPSDGDDHYYLDTAWIPLWGKPLVYFSWNLGEKNGAGGVYFGSRNFYGPWTWSWTEGEFGPEDHIIHFNGTRLGALNARTFNVTFGGAKAATYDPRETAPETLYVADTAGAAEHRLFVLGDYEDMEAVSNALNAKRALRWATRGDAATVLAGLDAAVPSTPPSRDKLGNLTALGHTGKPRREQRAGVEKA